MNNGELTLAASLLGACPVPRSRYGQILLGHGSGGQATIS